LKTLETLKLLPLVLRTGIGYLAVGMRHSAGKRKKLDYPEETEGSRLVAKVRKLASKLTAEEEAEHFRRGMAKIKPSKGP
jgi:hypothetical protein